MDLKTVVIIVLAAFSIMKIISISKVTKVIAEKAKTDLRKTESEEGKDGTID